MSLKAGTLASWACVWAASVGLSFRHNMPTERRPFLASQQTQSSRLISSSSQSIRLRIASSHSQCNQQLCCISTSYTLLSCAPKHSAHAGLPAFLCQNCIRILSSFTAFTMIWVWAVCPGRYYFTFVYYRPIASCSLNEAGRVRFCHFNPKLRCPTCIYCLHRLVQE